MAIATTKYNKVDIILLIAIVICGILNFVPNLIGIISLIVGFILLFCLTYRWSK